MWPNDFREQRLYCEEVDLVFKRHVVMLKALYSRCVWECGTCGRGRLLTTAWGAWRSAELYPLHAFHAFNVCLRYRLTPEVG